MALGLIFDEVFPKEASFRFPRPGFKPYSQVKYGVR